MKLSTPVTVPAIDELRAKQFFCPDGGNVEFEVAFFSNGAELNVSRLKVVARDAAASTGVVVNPARTSTGDAFVNQDGEATVSMAAGQLKLAVRSGNDDDSSLEALLAKAIELGIVAAS